MWKEIVTNCFKQYNCYVDIISYHKVATCFGMRSHIQANISLQTAIFAVQDIFLNIIKTSP
jgi:hypothetical protein